MIDIRWAPEATADLEGISLRIAQDSPEAALKTVRSIFRSVESLPSFPYSGRVGREPGTRELVLSPLPYIVVYRFKNEAVQIVHIRHGAQSRI